MQKRKTFSRKVLPALAAVSLVTGALAPVIGPADAAAASASVTVRLEPDTHSAFHDTDHDGYGEFQGFGTSLCWWANRCGYDNTLTTEAARLLYNPESGLGLTIARYNIGGGDDPSHNHITRSDSKLPGFWSAPAKVSAQEGQNYAAYDSASGYAWNYDWNADANQLNVALACQKEAGAEFQAETFSNSPPYFLTASGCSSGGKQGNTTNLRKDSYQAFATYLTDVTKHLKEVNGLNVTSMTGMNEPESSNWTANSAKQEGCHISPGKDQSKVVTSIAERLQAMGLSVTLSATDSSSVTEAADSYRKLSSAAKSAVGRIDSHAYVANDMPALRKLAQKAGKNLWMSEMDGTALAGIKAGEMSAGLGLAGYMNAQLNGLMPSAWIIWDAIDTHIDASNPADTDSITAEEVSAKDKNGFWGVLIADHNQKTIIRTKKYYAMGQYTRYIRPGYTLLGSSGNTTAAYDAKNKKIVVVIPNTKAKQQSCRIDLSQFGTVDPQATVQAVRTSGTLADGENWADVSTVLESTLNTTKKVLSTTLKGNSITTYIISGVSLNSSHNTGALSKISFTKKAVSGKMPSARVDVPKNILDGKYDTEYNCKKGWLEIDLKKKQSLKAFSYAASTLDPSATQGITISVSNTGKKWKKLYTISSLPSSCGESYIWKNDFKTSSKWRYLRLSKKKGTMGISEFTVYK